MGGKRYAPNRAREKSEPSIKLDKRWKMCQNSKQMVPRKSALYIPINSCGVELNGLFRRRKNPANGVPLAQTETEMERGAKFKIRPGVTGAAGRATEQAINGR